jgi:hypothetical protein
MITMADQGCVSLYADKMVYCWNTYFKRNIGSVNDRVYLLTLAVNEVHIRCGVPRITFSDLGNKSPTTIGTFDRTAWHMKLNYAVIGGYVDENGFMLMAEAIYHEARHAEQHWLIACLASSAIISMAASLDPQLMQRREELTKNIGVIPKNITSRAWGEAVRFNPSLELREKIKKWYESAYTHRFDYRRALVDIDSNIANNNPFLNDLREQAYRSYKSSAHEADAFDVQGLVHNKLYHMLMPRGPSPISFGGNYPPGDLIVF